MLVLCRKRNEEIVVNGPCVIRVVSHSAQGVRIGVMADRSTLISRTELLRGPRDLLWAVWERLTGRWGGTPIEVGAAALVEPSTAEAV